MVGAVVVSVQTTTQPLLSNFTGSPKPILEALETYTQKTIIIREKSNAATVRIKEAPQAQTPVPDDVLSAWRDGIDQLRSKERAGPDNPATVP